MTDSLPVFIRVLAVEFFRINAGFFLLAAGLCFGFLGEREHIAFAQYFTSSPALLVIPFIAWILYALKIVSFNRLTIHQRENRFLYAAPIMKPATLLGCLIATSALQLSPVIGYGLFLMSVAKKSGQLWAISAILISLMILTGFVSITIQRILKGQDEGIKVGMIARFFNRQFTRPSWWFYPAWISGRQPIMVVGTKFFGCLLLTGIARLYLYDAYDERLFQMGCAIVFAGNLMLVYFYHRFVNANLGIFRSLPIALERRLLNFMLAIGLLMVPEFGIMLRYFPAQLPVFQLIVSAVFGLSITTLAYACLYMKDFTIDQFMQKIFIGSLILISVILFRIPAVAVSVVFLLLSVFLYRKYFYSYEPNAEVH